MTARLRRERAFSLAFLATALFPPLVSSEPPKSLGLRIEVLQVENTGFRPACQGAEIDGEELDCVSTAVWLRYTARVRQVLQGSFEGEKISFVTLTSLHDPLLKDVFVFLQPVDSQKVQDQFETPFIADQIFFPSQQVCFPGGLADQLDLAVDDLALSHAGDGRRCVELSQVSANFPWRNEGITECDSREEEHRRVCERAALAEAEQRLVEVEANVLSGQMSGRFSRHPWSSSRSQASEAYSRASREFSHYVEQVCLFEGALAGNAMLRDSVKSRCEVRMIEDRIRLLYQQARGVD